MSSGSAETGANDDLTCRVDSKYTADLLLQMHEGRLTQEQENLVRTHLASCDDCRADYASLKELDLELMIAANDDAQLRKFRPGAEHAEACLLTTWDRLERFALLTSKSEFISDEELKMHINECVYCRRRSIITHRRAQHAGRLPLAYRLSEAAIKETMDAAFGQVWLAVATADSSAGKNTVRAFFPLRVRGARLNHGEQLARPEAHINLKGGCSLSVRFTPPQLLEILVTGFTELDCRRVLLVSAKQTERSEKLGADGVARFANVPDGEYYLRLERFKPGLLLVLQNGKVSIGSAPEVG